MVSDKRPAMLGLNMRKVDLPHYAAKKISVLLGKRKAHGT
jgi:hypothetical protein